MSDHAWAQNLIQFGPGFLDKANRQTFKYDHLKVEAKFKCLIIIIYNYMITVISMFKHSINIQVVVLIYAFILERTQQSVLARMEKWIRRIVLIVSVG